MGCILIVKFVWDQVSLGAKKRERTIIILWANIKGK